jgi:hypothetical protein
MSVSKMMLNIFNTIKSEMDNGNFDGLPDLHASSSGLKTYASWLQNFFFFSKFKNDN